MTHQYAHLALSPIAQDTADSYAKIILDGAIYDVGCIPRMYAVMANAPSLLDAYLHSYNRFREESTLTAAEQEVVLLLVLSVANGCSYVATHIGIAIAVAGARPEIIEAIRLGPANIGYQAE